MPITLQPLNAVHEAAYLAAVERSRALHHTWVAPPTTAEAFRTWLARVDGERNLSFAALDNAGDLVGCINLNEVVRGAFQSAYLGYYAFAPFAGTGMMKQAMTLVIDRAFNDLTLHRLEANIQPGNTASIALVKSLGFRHEGFSPNYLKINDAWRDHERFALSVEDWRSGSRQTE